MYVFEVLVVEKCPCSLSYLDNLLNNNYPITESEVARSIELGLSLRFCCNDRMVKVITWLEERF